MSFLDYLKDRSPAYMIFGFEYSFVLIFMTVFRIDTQIIVIISLILILGFVIIKLWEFFRRKRYYDRLLYCLNKSDQKYLLSEMIDNPDFYDGKIFYEILQETNKSMYENVANYRRANVKFREYIEIWVHEIKLPVASLQLILHNNKNPRYNQQLKLIDRYIDNVLYYARSENAEKDYIIKPVSLKEIFTDVAVRNREELQKLNIMLRTRNLDVNVMTDGKWLEFIFGQLTSNSVKYASHNHPCEIYVYAEDYPSKTVLYFHDNGIGIPKSDLPYIFEKSFTGENGRTHKKSTGMGLYIVKRLCDKLGHNISAKSTYGKYTEIVISFGKNNFYV